MSYQPGPDGRYAIPLVDFGNRLQNRFGLRVREHPAFGGVSGGHSPNSYHHYGEAIDITDYRPDLIDGVSWQQRTANLRDRLRGAGPEVIGPGDMKGHDTHLHLAATDGVLSLSPEQYKVFYGDQSGGRQATFQPMRFAAAVQPQPAPQKTPEREQQPQIRRRLTQEEPEDTSDIDFFRDKMKAALITSALRRTGPQDDGSEARRQIQQDLANREPRMAQVDLSPIKIEVPEFDSDALGKRFAAALELGRELPEVK